MLYTYEKDGVLTAQNTSVLFDEISPKKLKSRKYALTIERSSTSVTGTIAVTRKKLKDNLYSPWVNLDSGLNTLDLVTLVDGNNNPLSTYEFTDSDNLINEVLVIATGIVGGTVRVSLIAW
jgi:hypothetical protein